MKKIKCKTMVELKAAIYDDNNWKREAGESMAARINLLYDIGVDMKHNVFVATRKSRKDQL